MDQKLIAILDRLEQRWADEQEEQSRISRDEAWSKVDSYLLPVGPETGRLMNDLIVAAGSQTIVEVGSSYGYSTLWLADAAKQSGGRVISLELSAEKIAFAKGLLAEAGLQDQVEFIQGDALETLPTIAGPIDFVLMDLWKDLYLPCYEIVRSRLGDGAIIISDNMIFPPDNHANALEFRNRILDDPAMDSVLLPIGAGVELSRLRPQNYPRP